eukprot:gene6803-9318_t
MAFFGLTALGPQNSFAAAATFYRNFHIFEEQDFTDAWNKINKGKSFCKLSDLNSVMVALFRGPIPGNEIEPLTKAFEGPFDTPDAISFDVYLKIMIQLAIDSENEQKALDGKIKPSCDFISSREFSETLKKNATSKSREIKAKQTTALTASQEYGWSQPEKLEGPVAGRGGSDITKFAAELIKNGIYY